MRSKWGHRCAKTLSPRCMLDCSLVCPWGQKRGAGAAADLDFHGDADVMLAAVLREELLEFVGDCVVRDHALKAIREGRTVLGLHVAEGQAK